MCRICKPSLSSKWDSINEDWTRFDKEHYYKDENRKLFPGAQEKFLNYIDLSELELVRIVGGEPFLSKRQLYSSTSSSYNKIKKQDLIVNFIDYCDGNNSLREINSKLGVKNILSNKILNILIKNNLVAQI